MNSEYSAGAVVFRKTNGKILYLLVHLNPESGNHWMMPKGHVEEGESEIQAAEREILEETGLKVQFIKDFQESITYTNHIKKMEKTVVFFLAETKEEAIQLQEEELQDYTWLEYEAAIQRLTQDNSKEILRKAHKFLKHSIK